MTRQTTIGKAFSVSGAGLHTGRRSIVTLRPAPADFGCRVSRDGGAPVPMSWAHWTPSVMSTSLDLGGGRTVRTIEHMMAALSAYGIDNVAVELDGPEIPIFDGSAAPWCRQLGASGVVPVNAPRRAIRVVAPVQVARDGGFLRVEPADAFAIDVTHDLLPAFPVMRWAGTVGAAGFDAGIARARSFGNLHRRLGLAPPSPAHRPAGEGHLPNQPDRRLPAHEAVWTGIAMRRAARSTAAPLLRGWRPWRATLVAGRHILPSRRFPDEPVRHVALDMIGDLALAGAPLLGRVVAHNPSHEKTYALVAALMAAREAWEVVDT